MGKARAVTEFDGFVGQQAQGPARPALGRLTASQSRDAGPLFPVNTDGAARARLLVQSLQSPLEIAVTPTGHALPTHLEYFRNVEQRVTGLQLEQGRSSLEGAGLGTTTTGDRYQMGLVDGA
jgi:hypothetical protein